jgi:hypothetical protein
VLLKKGTSNLPQRIALLVNLGEGKPLPSNIVGLLREDLLGSGVHIHVASITSFTDGVVSVIAEVNSAIDAEPAALQSVAQKHLDEIYGALHAAEEEVEAEEQEEDDDSLTSTPPATSTATPPATQPPSSTPAPAVEPSTASAQPSETETTAEASSTTQTEETIAPEATPTK